MLQVDGSPHDWLEGRGSYLTLVGAIDDATSQVPGAFFVEAESSWAYLKLFLGVFKKKGLPHSVYSDRHKIFFTDRQPTIEEQLADKRPRTQVGRALEQLGITLIPAGSPQAKGRVERLWGTFQDRLVSELRLEGAKTKQQAQAILDRYLPQHNRRFGSSLPVRPSQPGARWTLKPYNKPCALSTNGWWLRTTPCLLKQPSFRSPKDLLVALMLARESMCTCFWMGEWSFSTRERKLPSSIPKRLTHLAYIERTELGRCPAMDLKPLPRQICMNYHPDIFMLLLT